jgi:hypothetical protein
VSTKEDVDGRNKSGHDGCGVCIADKSRRVCGSVRRNDRNGWDRFVAPL